MSAVPMAPQARPPVELRFRYKVSRRQAQYRMGPADTWHTMLVSLADKAIRESSITLGGIEFPVVVSRETTDTPVYPHKAAFTERAIALNDSINAMFIGRQR